jgi:sporulation protein YlmC with PRC-barrel domain
MVLIIKQICGDKLGALDGEIGHVKDLYFDDQNWAVRYLVADTGSWMSGRLVLISPYAFGDLYQGGRMLLVNLTRQQIENSPSIESHKPVSRQYEEEYHQYYNWPFYWDGWEVWGMSGFPILPQKTKPFQGEPAAVENKKPATGDSHLRSANTIVGYHIQAGNETIGRVTDFVMDEKTWVIRHLVVDIRHWMPGKRVLISPKQIQRISWDEWKVFVDLTKEAVLGLPVFDPASFGIVEHDPRVFM